MYRVLGVALLLVLLFDAQRVEALTLRFVDFAEIGSLRFAGTARAADGVDGPVLRLTTAPGQGQAGSVFVARKISAREFHTAFTFRISSAGGITNDDCPGGEAGADGLVFVVQNAEPRALGAPGEGIGYHGIPNSIGVEFDTWCNAPENDTSRNHVAVDIGGSTKHGFPNGPKVDVPQRLDNGALRFVWVDYRDSLLEVRIAEDSTRPSQAILRHTVNIESDVIGAPEAFVGFTAATGRAWATHDLVSWEVSDEEGALSPRGSISRYRFARALFDFMGIPDTVANRKAFVAWATSESSTACQPHAEHGNCKTFDSRPNVTPRYCFDDPIMCKLHPDGDQCICEERPGHGDCKWNPINTTHVLDKPGLPPSIPCNSVNVQRYPTCLAGLYATARTLRSGGAFQPIFDAFRQQRGTDRIVDAISRAEICGNPPGVGCPLIRDIWDDIRPGRGNPRAEVNWQAYKEYGIYPAAVGTCVRDNRLRFVASSPTRGFDVLEVQNRLTALTACYPSIGFDVAYETGAYDSRTRDSVREFERVVLRKRPSGIVENRVWKALHLPCAVPD